MTLIATAHESTWSIDVVHNMDVAGKGYARPLAEIVQTWEQQNC
jgi:hypothetical protein